MFSFLTNLLGRPQPTAPAATPTRLGVTALEGRDCPTVSSVMPLALRSIPTPPTAQITVSNCAYVNIAYNRDAAGAARLDQLRVSTNMEDVVIPVGNRNAVVTVYGTNLGDLIMNNTRVALTAYGFGGDDNISGGDGNDFLFGGDGNDTLTGWGGNDHLNGQGGNDWLHGLSGNDYLFGEDGDDVLFGGTGEDRLNGQNGRDTLHGGDGDDFLDGGLGLDTFTGGLGADVFIGSQDWVVGPTKPKPFWGFLGAGRDLPDYYFDTITDLNSWEGDVRV